MNDIFNLSILDLIPPNLKNDEKIVTAAKALDEELIRTSKSIKETILFARIDELDEDKLDLLAWQLHVDSWDRNIDIETKRALIKNSFKIHRMKGTPHAVEKLIETLFGDGYVEEWFEYGGQPYTFRVITNNSAVTNERAEEFIKALNSVKNLRSWLDKVVITQAENLDIYFAGVVHIGDRITIKEG